MTNRSLFPAVAALFAFSSVAHAQTQIPISQLPSAATPLSGAEIVPCIQGGVTKGCLDSSLGPPSATTLSMTHAAMTVSAASASATFTADEIIVRTALSGAPYHLANYSQAVNLTGTGAGGMDTGTSPVSGFVALYAIYNPGTGATSILATNATSSVAPSVYGGANMPAGYTASALVSVWPTNASGQLAPAFQSDRTISTPTFTVLLSSVIQSTPTALSIAAAVPKNARTVFGAISASSTAMSNLTLSVFPTGNAAQIGTQGVLSFGATAGFSLAVPFQNNVSVPQTIYYDSSSSAGTPTFSITIVGYTI